MSSHFEPIILSARDASASLYPYGAHVTGWRVGGRECLFTSSTTALRPGTAIRGGVPIIFPQFAALGPLPKHGFARTALWQTVSVSNDQVTLRLHDNEATRAQWPHEFVADYVVSLGSDLLSMTLTITHLGSPSGKPCAFTAALHTYLRVQDIAQVTLHGLQGLRYIDSAAGGSEVVQPEAALRIAGEVDRIYFSTTQSIVVREPGARTMQCSAEGFTDTVIWNPGPEKALALADLEPEGYRRMVCVEAAIIGQPVQLEVGASWSGTQTLRLLNVQSSNQESA